MTLSSNPSRATPTQPEEWDHVAELVQEAAAGSSTAWSELVDRFSPLVLAIARRHRLNDSDVDDVFQIVWLRLAENLTRIDDPRRVAGWLTSTTRNESLRLIGRLKRVEHVEPIDLADDGPDVDTGVARKETISAVASAFAALDGRCRQLLRALIIDTEDYDEVSERFDMPVGSIGPTRRRCLERLRKLLPLAEVTFT